MYWAFIKLDFFFSVTEKNENIMSNVVCLFMQNNLRLRSCYVYFQKKRKKKNKKKKKNK